MHHYSYLPDGRRKPYHPSIAIPHPLGNPALTAEDEYALRYKLTEAAVKAFSVEVDKQTVFEV